MARCSTLSGATAAADDVAREVGEVVEQQDGALRVRPRDELFSDAWVVREPDGEVAHVELELSVPGSLDALSAAFGEYTTPPALHPGRERRAVFYVEAPSQLATCAVIARLGSGTRAGAVTGVTVRRDA